MCLLVFFFVFFCLPVCECVCFFVYEYMYICIQQRIPAQQPSVSRANINPRGGPDVCRRKYETDVSDTAPGSDEQPHAVRCGKHLRAPPPDDNQFLFLLTPATLTTSAQENAGQRYEVSKKGAGWGWGVREREGVWEGGRVSRKLECGHKCL